MKKILLGVLVVALALGLTACSQEFSSKLGELMGNMGHNIYGISANSAAADAAVNKVDESCESDGSVDLDKAASIMSDVQSVKTSPSNTEYLKDSLNKPIAKDETTSLAVKSNIEGAAADSKTALEEATVPEGRGDLANTISGALESVTVSENPTKAELVTVAVISQMSKDVVNVSDSEELAAKGKQALDTLMITTDAASIDLFGDLDVAALVSGISGSDSADEDETAQKVATSMSTSIAKAINAVTSYDESTETYHFDAEKYDKLIMEFKAIKAAFDMTASNYELDLDAPLADQIEPNDGLVVEDLGHYVLATAAVLVDAYVDHDVMVDLLDSFITANGAVLMDLSKYADEVEELDESKLDEVKASVLGNLGLAISEDHPIADVIDAMMSEDGALYNEGSSFLKTVSVILANAEYDNVISLVKDDEGNAATTLRDAFMILVGNV